MKRVIREDLIKDMKIDNIGVNLTQRKILELIKQKEIASKLKTTVRTIERNINILKQKKIIKRIGTDKTGYWKIL